MFFCLLLFGLFIYDVLGSPKPYNESYAIRTLYFAYGAYCPASQLEAWDCKWCKNLTGFNVSKVYEKDHLLGFVGYDTEYSQIVVSFRGTHNIFDWIDDFEYEQIPYPGVNGGLVHKGFYDSWTKELYPVLFNVTTELMDKYKNYNVLVTGHSLGAAVAQIASIDFKNYGIKTGNTGDVYLYEYGSPRWGNVALINYYQELITTNWRLVNIHDIVPTVPHENEHGYLYHHSRMLYIFILIINIIIYYNRL